MNTQYKMKHYKTIKIFAWNIAFGLQEGKVSINLLDLSNRNIKGELSLQEVNKLIEENGLKEDILSSRIANILSTNAFSLRSIEYLLIHIKLFKGVLKFDYKNINESLEELFTIENSFTYKGLTEDEIINHISIFISKLWNLHIFEEGNTRTTAIYLIKYLNLMGYKNLNNIFKENYSYFKESLIKSNEDIKDLELFIRDLVKNTEEYYS